MVVDDLNVLSAAIRPGKADAVLIVDANAVLTASVAGQRLQPVSRERRQVAKLLGGVQLLELSLRDAGDLLVRRLNRPANNASVSESLNDRIT